MVTLELGYPVYIADVLIATPRRTGNSPNDVTSYHPGHHFWNRDNLQETFYTTEMPQSWHVFKTSGLPPPLLDSSGNEVYEAEPRDPNNRRVLLAFPILPMKIGTFEEWWWLEQVRDIDPRIRWVDIEMRMVRLYARNNISKRMQ